MAEDNMLVDAALVFLSVLAAADSEIAEIEMEEIADFINRHYIKSESDQAAIIFEKVATSSEDDRLELYKEAVLHFRTESIENRLALLDHALSLVASDGVLDDRELFLFSLAGKTWGFDVKSYLKDRLG